MHAMVRRPMTEFLGYKMCLIMALCGLCSLSQAAPVNGSFESGDFSGWQLEIPRGLSQRQPHYRPAGGAQAVSSWGQHFDLTAPGLLPANGDYFAALNTAADASFTGQRTYHLALSQLFWLSKGDIVTGWSSFYNGDCIAQDSAWVKIMDVHGMEIASPWHELSGSMNSGDPASTPYRSFTPWIRWEWQAPAEGSYVLSLGMTTSGDDTAASFGFFDDLCVQAAASAVPEPTSVSLLVLGVFVLANVRRAQTGLRIK
jgi:hypothetical protein